MFICCECCVLSGRGLCDELITRPEESYRLWCVVVCDLETSRMRTPWPSLGRSATAKKKETYFTDRSQKIYFSYFKSRHVTSCPRLLLCFNTNKTNTADTFSRYVRFYFLVVKLQKACHLSFTSVRIANLALNIVLQQMFVGIDFGVNSNKLLLCYWNLLLHHKYHHPLWFCTPCEPDSYYNPTAFLACWFLVRSLCLVLVVVRSAIDNILSTTHSLSYL
jgi:hypothetical protein